MFLLNFILFYTLGLHVNKSSKKKERKKERKYDEQKIKRERSNEHRICAEVNTGTSKALRFYEHNQIE